MGILWIHVLAHNLKLPVVAQGGRGGRDKRPPASGGGPALKRSLRGPGFRWEAFKPEEPTLQRVDHRLLALGALLPDVVGK